MNQHQAKNGGHREGRAPGSPESEASRGPSAPSTPHATTSTDLSLLQTPGQIPDSPDATERLVNHGFDLATAAIWGGRTIVGTGVGFATCLVTAEAISMGQYWLAGGGAAVAIFCGVVTWTCARATWSAAKGEHHFI